MHQDQFDRLKVEVQQGSAQHGHELHAFTQQAGRSIPAPKTEAGAGGPGSIWILTPQAMNQMARSAQANGYSQVSLGSAWPPHTYQGHMLGGEFHLLDPVYRGLKADFHV